ncbi:MAG: helix-turn-helix transcriptional regulator [Clostridia bacterium]|nr:helix-turn-helix transcriptional regulator [Clostridia bacterium]
MKIFQDRLKEMRKIYRYTQREMADFLNISQPSYIRYENGSAEPSQENLVKIAEIFDVSTDYLLGKDDI